MKINPCLRVALFLVIFLSAIGTPAQTQDKRVDIVYTGRMLGYFRVPSLQDFKAINGCPAHITRSKAADVFETMRTELKKPAAIFVSTGDNFAPQLEARVFSNPPANDDDKTKYAVGNKELYFGSKDEWVFYEKIKSDKYKDLREKIEQGLGTIPNDNVACFLRQAGYAAIVPGKHDFYFGAERVRQFARFLAAPAPEKSSYQPVEMLGANLVIKTEPIESESVPDSVIKKRPFESWPDAYPLLNLQDRSSVYPWFSVVKIQLVKIKPQSTLLTHLKALADADSIIGDPALDSFIAAGPINADNEAYKKNFEELKTNRNAIKTRPVRICIAKGNPNQPPSECENPESSQIRIIDNSIVLYAYLKKKFKAKDDKHFSTVASPNNYLLCTQVPDPKKPKELNELKDACTRFSVNVPFFYFPHRVPNDKDTNDGYTDPEPYVIKDNVAIFGVVDPGLSQQVGILNFGWKHDGPNALTSHVSVEDPAEALQQQLDYFKIQSPDFSGLKVLLAQMPPEHARALAAKFPEFQIVVSAADYNQATTNVTMTTDWKPNARAAGTFLAVPTPYFDPVAGKGTVHLGLINACTKTAEKKVETCSQPEPDAKAQPDKNAGLDDKKQPADPKPTGWHLSATAIAGKPVDSPDDETAADLWDKIKGLPGCLKSGFDRKQGEENEDNKTYLKWLVLCSMQQYTGSDVALIQTRDLFDRIPALDAKAKDLLDRAPKYEKGKVPDENVQQMLDRLIWKGDLVILLHVPGSALKAALKQSGEYAALEEATLATSVETGRKLETLGIRNEGGAYFINDLPLDDNRVYAVAVTDFIEAGDTGYPDLVKAARNPRTHPAAFTGDLVPISSLVCNKIFSDPVKIAKFCLQPVDSEKYLDTTTAEQTPSYKPQSRLAKIWKATGFAWPDPAKPPTSVEVAVERNVQQRSFWAFSLKNLSVGFKDLDNNDTDKSLSLKFAGIPLSGVTAKETRNITIGLDTRLSYFADKQEVFLGLGIDYDRQSTGNPVTLTSISQNKNRLFSDIGVVLWRRPGRALPNAGVVFSMRAETQLERPFSSFALSTKNEEGNPDEIRIPQKRSLLLLGRVGMRWQSKSNSFEIGGQFGRELRALRGYRFDNPGGSPFECLVESGRPLGKCIEDNSTLAGPISVNSIPNALIQGRPRAGIYWNHAFSIPISSKLKYEVTQDADYFFVNFADSSTIDTRFRFNGKNSIQWAIWPNFSIGPTLEILMFRNQKEFSPVLQETIGGKFLFQRTIGIEAKINFDIFNRREKLAQIIARP